MFKKKSVFFRRIPPHFACYFALLCFSQEEFEHSSASQLFVMPQREAKQLLSEWQPCQLLFRPSETTLRPVLRQFQQNVFGLTAKLVNKISNIFLKISVQKKQLL